ncbi:hypothetical protein ACWDCC_15670 [Streptomyces sp. NPDC001102]
MLSYRPACNPVERVRAHLKNSLATWPPFGIDDVAALSRHRPERMQ